MVVAVRRLTAGALCVGAAAFLAGCAQPLAPAVPPAPPAAAQPTSLAPEVSEALRRMSATLAAAPAFNVRMTSQREGRLQNGQTVLLSAQTAIIARRPNRLLAAVGSDLGSFTLWYDGTAVTVLSPLDNVYAATPFTGGLEEAVVWLERRMGIDIPIRPLLAVDPYAAMLEAGPTTGVRLGRSLLRDAAVEHFALRNPDFDWEIWLDATPAALPRRVSLVERNVDQPARITIDFDEWVLSPRLPDRVFAFVPPPGAVAATMILKPE